MKVYVDKYILLYCSGELAPLFLTTLLGLSNGLWGSLPMILAPAALPEHQVPVDGAAT
jgi:hypothetical protein